MKTHESTHKTADWSKILPELIHSQRYPAGRNFSDAILAIAQAAERQEITKAEAEIVLKELLAAFIDYEIASIMPGNTGDLWHARNTRRRDVGWPNQIFFTLGHQRAGYAGIF